MTQAARLESLERFRSGAIAFLIATDVAARGLDIQGVEVGGWGLGGLGAGGAGIGGEVEGGP
jgi:late competence protein required for DNA uptake (superfamily II DNA/RNA helicase)